jgi:hypothetical protein
MASKARTPVRRALRDGSPLLVAVVDGFGAVKKTDHDCFEQAIRSYFADSLDLDKALKPGRDREHRWDYLLGHGPSMALVAVEPHSAKQDQISRVIEKRRQARDQLKEHLLPGTRVTKWLWVASGRVQFADTEKARRLLDQNGIEFVGRQVRAKHLPVAASSETRSRGTRRQRSRPAKE